ncbi:nucleotide exchange factor GrpE [Methanococcoides orientis]|uniref:nucleotide exchange factor GrpE n=1 Tax=Methanococcoides orientis TaxID=2822137 RepID=UPI001E3AFB4F|nr:nucleotide exchange factor GrpE [Methanococcoides orientis]UGV40022.1 nucleotide exchange factor GrpE [Methanococcoides orientis]
MVGKFGKKSKVKEEKDSCTGCKNDDLSEKLAGNGGDDQNEDIPSTDSDIIELKEQLIRQRAEFENFRKRSVREKEEFRKFALENMMVEMLEVYDNFERALESAKKTDDVNSVIEGVEMVFRQFISILEKEGLKKIDCTGQEFDPHLHEAMMHVQTSEHPEGHVVDVCKPGYELNSKVIRHAMVTIADNPDEN